MISSGLTKIGGEDYNPTKKLLAERSQKTQSFQWSVSEVLPTFNRPKTGCDPPDPPGQLCVVCFPLAIHSDQSRMRGAASAVFRGAVEQPRSRVRGDRG
jgi:hypothetical protein